MNIDQAKALIRKEDPEVFKDLTDHVEIVEGKAQWDSLKTSNYLLGKLLRDVYKHLGKGEPEVLKHSLLAPKDKQWSIVFTHPTLKEEVTLSWCKHPMVDGWCWWFSAQAMGYNGDTKATINRMVKEIKKLDCKTKEYVQ